MKNIIRLFGIAVLAAAMTFGMTACDNGGDPEDTKNPSDGVDGAGGDPLDSLPLAERWTSRAEEGAGVTIAHSLDDDGVCAITVGGTALDGAPAWDHLWKAAAKYQYTAKKDTVYTFSFEAWTDGGGRTMNVQWYENRDDEVYHGTGFDADQHPTFKITPDRKTYNVTDKEPIPKSGVQDLTFQCANQTGKFYVKIISITSTPFVAKTITITGITGKSGKAFLFIRDEQYEMTAQGEGTVSGGSVSFTPNRLTEEGFLTGDLWYGSGSYYLEICFESNNMAAGLVYTAGGEQEQKYNITSTPLTIPFSQFAQVGGGGTDGVKTEG